MTTKRERNENEFIKWEQQSLLALSGMWGLLSFITLVIFKTAATGIICIMYMMILCTCFIHDTMVRLKKGGDKKC